MSNSSSLDVLTETGLRKVIDARDQLCPAPLLMVKKRVLAAQRGELIEVIVNDQTSKANILSYCLNRGDLLVDSWEDGKDFHLTFRKSDS